MKVYHYARVSSVPGIFGVEGERPGLVLPERNNSSLGRSLFTLFEPEPKEWTQNRLYPGAMDKLREYVSMFGTLGVLLEIDLLPTDKVEVVEFAHIAERHASAYGARLRRSSSFVKKYWHDTEKDAEKAYRQSAISLEQYVEEKRHYVLPEVVVYNDIPLERVRIATDQPFLREGVFMQDAFRDTFMDVVQKVPELWQWYQEQGKVMHEQEKRLL